MRRPLARRGHGPLHLQRGAYKRFTERVRPVLLYILLSVASVLVYVSLTYTTCLITYSGVLAVPAVAEGENRDFSRDPKPAAGAGAARGVPPTAERRPRGPGPDAPHATLCKNPAKYLFGSRCFGTRSRIGHLPRDFSLSATPFHFFSRTRNVMLLSAPSRVVRCS